MRLNLKNKSRLIGRRIGRLIIVYYPALICAFLGFLFFALIFGVSIINPQNDAWITNLNGDISQHYIGWIYFRESVWSLPHIGNILNLGQPSGISITYLDSIPLFALMFKLFSGILPETFQYLGLFSVLSYMLQGLFGGLIIMRFTTKKAATILGSLFFILTPILFGREFSHTALTAHWLILLGILLLIVFHQRKTSSVKRVLAWSVVMTLAVLIHPYFVPILGSILLLSVIDQYYKNVLSSVLTIVIPSLFTLFTLWLLGGLSRGMSTIGDPKLGEYSTDLFSLFRPSGYSYFLSNSPSVSWEGMAYLGAGILLMGSFAWLYALTQLKHKMFIKELKEYLKKPKLYFYIVAVTGIVVFSMSPQIHIDGNLIASVPIPLFIQHLWETFRSTGRVFWSLYYLIIIIILVSALRLARKLHINTAILLLPFCIIQAIDLYYSPALQNKTISINESLQDSTQPSDSINSLFIGRYCHVKEVIVLDDNLEVGIELFHELSPYIITCKPVLNTGYFARYPSARILDFSRREQNKLLSGPISLSQDTLYLSRSKDISKKLQGTGWYTITPIGAYWVIN
jgi:Family of unknown function (DUF6311)